MAISYSRLSSIFSVERWSPFPIWAEKQCLHWNILELAMKRKYLLCRTAQRSHSRDKKSGRKHSDVEVMLSLKWVMICERADSPESSAGVHKLWQKELWKDLNKSRCMCAPLPSPLDLSRKNENIFKLCSTEISRVYRVLQASTSRDEPEEAWDETPAVPPTLVPFMGRRTQPWDLVLAQATPGTSLFHTLVSNERVHLTHGGWSQHWSEIMLLTLTFPLLNLLYHWSTTRTFCSRAPSSSYIFMQD